ncbi:MAG: 50S ribosomal protein L4, partial [Chloroflexi bacterium]|nr:50S ribosomal protein L4 [Chloroflexota bacterium]
MQLPVVNIEGGSVGTLEVSDLLFDVPMNAAVVHQAMLYHRANARQGTASAKTRGMVSGGGAKPRPQKHTGRSRQGSIRSPQWRGGGVVFGPQPRSFRQRLPKKMRRLAIRC